MMGGGHDQMRLDLAGKLPISLVITILNEEQSLPSFLSSIAAMEWLPSEIVVVDGGSIDSSLSLLESWDAPSGVVLSIFSRPGANISEGRNIGIANAAFDAIAVTDAGTTLSLSWLRLLFDALDAGADVASGFFVPSGTRLVESAIAAVITPTVDEIDSNTFLPSSRSAAFRKSAWEAAGHYPEWLDYCEDLVFDIAMKESGARFAFVSTATVTWNARPTLKAFARQYFRYARGDGKASLWRRRHAVRYSTYILGAVLAVSGFWFPVAWILLAIGMGIYFSVFVRRVLKRRGWLGAHLGLALLLVPVVVVTGDFAKMIGYPVGVRWRRTNSSLIALGAVS